MKIVLVALNAKYIHTNLAVRSIGKFCSELKPEICEYTINDNIDSIIASLHSKRADVLAFSCYIWNIEKVLYIAQCLKKVNKELKIILGGHEVSHDAKRLLQENPQIDYIIRGEGEIPSLALFKALNDNSPIETVPSLSYRNKELIEENPLAPSGDLNDYPFAYDDSIGNYKGKIIYYESSRGCPYNCSYCLSGDNRKVNYLDIERVKKELSFFISKKVPLVKFVDRTFNADKKRANEIWKFIIENSSDTCFHFELAGNLIDDEALEILKDAPKGIIQFEIGVQSTNEKTVSAIGRSISFEKVKENVKKLLSFDNIHIHLDLIAGLPYEDISSFKKSFDDVVSIRPQVLQLGFLKLLKGSKLRSQIDEFGYRYKEKAPYEIMENDFITFDEIIMLKEIEEIFDKYYNSGDFSRTMDFLFGKFESPFMIFDEIRRYYIKNELFEKSVSIELRYELLERIFSYEGISDCVKLDRLTNKKAKLSYENTPEFKERSFEFLKNPDNVEKYLPEYSGLQPRKIYTQLRFETAFGKVFVYETKKGNLQEITEDF